MELIKLVTGLCATNTYLIINDGAAIVVDPGAEPHKILDCLQKHKAELKYILITHAHFDHVGAVAALRENGVTVYMSEIDTKLCDEICSVGEDIYVSPFDVDVTVNDGDVLKLLGIEFRVISASGHTPGSVCYVMNDKTIFSGDTLFRLSVGRTDFPCGDRAQLLESLKKLFELEHDYEVLPGHGMPTSLYFEREKNPYAH